MYDNEVRMYILVRNDLDSLSNRGLACAQVSHAANQCVKEFDFELHGGMLNEWEIQTGHGFGTTIVLRIPNLRELESIIKYAKMNGRIHAGIVFDDSYPVRDGSVIHEVPVYSCGYLLGEQNDVLPFVNNLELLS